MVADIICEFQAQLDEWKTLQKHASNPKIIAQIDNHINTLQEKINRTASQSCPQKINVPVKLDAELQENNSPKISSVTIQSYSWEQDDSYVRIFITLDGIQNIPSENISLDLTKSSLQLQVLNLNNKNYKLSIPKLSNNIDTNGSSYKLKKNAINIILKKSGLSHWNQLNFKEMIKPKKQSKVDPNDPGSSLMDLMKNLYDEGDDEMKRTIMKAWTEAQQKRF